MPQFPRLKQIRVTKKFTDEDVFDEAFADGIVASFGIMKPFVDYLSQFVI